MRIPRRFRIQGPGLLLLHTPILVRRRMEREAFHQETRKECEPAHASHDAPHDVQARCEGLLHLRAHGGPEVEARELRDDPERECRIACELG